MQETYISVLPLFHVYGIYAVTLFAMIKGDTAILMSGFNPTAYMKCIEDYKVGWVLYTMDLLRCACKK